MNMCQLLKLIFNYITGPPCPPVVEFTQSHLVNDIIYSHLSWSAPFTFEGFPITNYSVTKFNHSNGDTITIVWIANNYSAGYRYSYQSLSQGNHCYELDFTVVAANRLGSSQPAVVHARHPIGIILNHVCYL